LTQLYEKDCASFLQCGRKNMADVLDAILNCTDTAMYG